MEITYLDQQAVQCALVLHRACEDCFIVLGMRYDEAAVMLL